MERLAELVAAPADRSELQFDRAFEGGMASYVVAATDGESGPGRCLTV